MALGFHASSIQEDKDQSQLCSRLRNDTRSDTKSSHLSASQFHEKGVRFTSLSNSRCIFKMTLGPVPYFLTEKSILTMTSRDSPEHQRSGCWKADSLRCFLHLQAIPNPQAQGPFPWAQRRGEWGLTVGDRGRLSPQNYGSEESEVVGLFSARQSAPFPPFSFRVWHTFPCLSKTSASSWGKGEARADGFHSEANTWGTRYLICMVFGAWTKCNCLAF